MAKETPSDDGAGSGCDQVTLILLAFVETARISPQPAAIDVDAKPLSLKSKGDLAELRIAADLVARGYRVAIPFGEDCDFDLLLIRDSGIERVQVKHVKSDGQVIPVRCRSHSLTNGKVRRTKHYTSDTIDLLAIYDAATDACFYVPAAVLGTGRTLLHLRLKPARNGQVARTRPASQFQDP